MNAPVGSPADARLTLRERLTREWESRPLVGMRTESAADRMVRRMALTAGCAGMIAAVLELPRMFAHNSAVGGWASAAAFVAFAMFPALAAVAVLAPIRAVRSTAGATAVVYLAAAAVVSSSFDHTVPESLATWMFRAFSLGVIVASVAWRAPVSIAYMLVGNVGLALGSLTAIVDPSVSWFLGMLLRSTGLCALFLWCSIYAQKGAIGVDREAAAAGSRAARVAGAAARDRERARFAALIHDAVLSTLLDASRSGAESPVLRAQAARTLEQLDALRRGTAGPERFDADSVSMFLGAAVREASSDITVRVTRAPGCEALEMPVDTAGTLTAATVEAVRNSLRHASAGNRVVRRGVDLNIEPSGVVVRVHDDGAGFDPHKVPVDRLGLTVSILGRMRNVPGGAAEIESRPGQGTVVTLRWTAGRDRFDPGVLLVPQDGSEQDRKEQGSGEPERAGQDRVGALAVHREGV